MGINSSSLSEVSTVDNIPPTSADTGDRPPDNYEILAESIRIRCQLCYIIIDETFIPQVYKYLSYLDENMVDDAKVVDRTEIEESLKQYKYCYMSLINKNLWSTPRPEVLLDARNTALDCDISRIKGQLEHGKIYCVHKK